ncbi:MAG: TIGR01777 family protein [Actinobacteria bacterium]|nr:TIGR01777 family protein [Actinomycetota bacterium]NCW92752.1 TIGR01777 family protein [Actinomycetota bacterium]NCX16477.1 TIGR01777 family protein [Actinomycetota bacterium]NDE39150.1 TIGR01777 family protein [Actinomycetota bacterium]
MRVPQRIAISGSSGLIGTALVGHLKSEGHTVQRLVRRAPVASDEVQWDPQTGFVDLSALAGVDAIIHLAGVGVGDKRWTKRYKSEILNSRLLGTTTIAKAVAELKPQVFISASAIGWYGESGNRAVVETDRVGDDFLAAVCREWEGAADLAADVRTVKIRTGLVLDPTGGALGKMLPLFRLGFGGKLGSGKQWWSWITLHDQIRAIVFALENPLSGPVNVTSPNPVTNQEFTSALARALHRPALFPAPAIALKIALGGFSSEVLGSKKVIPHVLQEAGFTWDYPHITEALNQLVQD